MEKIKNVWFEDGSICMKSSTGRSYHRPVSDFPILAKATDEQRERFRIVLGGKALRWDEIDEDIHISSFYEQKGERNELASIFYNFPMLTISGVADYLGMNKTLLYNYVYGLKRPSENRLNEIKSALHDVGTRLATL